MRSRLRFIAILALVILLFALPGNGLAGNPPAGLVGKPATGSTAQLPAAAVAPVLVPGAQVLTVGFGDTSAFDLSAGATVVYEVAGVGLATYSSVAGGFVTVAPRLPAGATIWQIDAYGYAAGATTQTFTLETSAASTGVLDGITFPASTTGPGFVQSTLTFLGSGDKLVAGKEWLLTANSAHSVNNPFVGAVFQYTLPTVALNPITPIRVFDSRIARFGGAISHTAPRTINVKDAINVLTGAVTLANAIPLGAKAVSYNLTVTNTVGAGNIDVLPGAATTITGSSINWTKSGETIANGGLVTLGTGANERQVTIVLSGTSAHVIFDVTGYYW